MKASEFTEVQKAFILKQGEAVAELCRKAGISQATYFNWKKRYGGLLPDEMRRLKALEEENGRLKRLLAESLVDQAALKDLLSRNVWSALPLQGSSMATFGFA